MTSDTMDRPICTVEAKCWLDKWGGRYEIALQVMYYTDSALVRGAGPFFIVGHERTKKRAEERVAEMNRRLQESEAEIAAVVAAWGARE
jgi:hypothetical protein